MPAGGCCKQSCLFWDYKCLVSLHILSWVCSQQWQIKDLYPVLDIKNRLFHFRPFRHRTSQLPRFLCVMTTIASFTKFILLYIITNSSKWQLNNLGVGLKGKITANWNQKSSPPHQRIKECKHYYMFVKFPWRSKGVKPKVQSIGVRFFHSFHLKLFLVLPENSFHRLPTDGGSTSHSALPPRTAVLWYYSHFYFVYSISWI